MKRDASSKKNQIRWLVILILASLILIAALSALCMPFFSKLSDPAFQAQLRIWIDSLGLAGWLVMLGIQMAQIVIALIPGEPVELLAGVIYGAWGGLFTCLLGIVLASAAVFFTVRRFGYPLIERTFGKAKLEQFSFLNNTKKIETLTFILFLIPGTPKDMLTYFAGVSPIKASHFLFLSTFARIPSIITSTLMGATMSQGNWTMTLLIFLLTAIIGLVGILYKNKLMDRLHKHHDNR